MKTILFLCRLTLSSVLFCAPALAGNLAIENAQVSSGQVSFEGLQGDHATITQSSQKAIVDYQRFDVLSGGSVTFDQPSAQAAILNRIAGADPSMINGSIQANGQVFFVNPAGITFGPNSVIRADTFMAVAGQIADGDFLAGQLDFNLTGEVSNYGSIETLNNNALLGDKVFNVGDIVSRNGISILSAGDEVLLRANGSSLAVQLRDRSEAETVGVAIENSGKVSGEEVLFSAGDAYSVALKQSGSVRAERSAKLYSDGGKIEVTGEVSAQSGAGAGLIEVGGTYRGGDTAPVASEVYIADTAVLDASAIAEGDGGEVIVYADRRTTMLGAIYAEGQGEGQGGFAEISAKYLELGDGVWDIHLGQGGSLLFDPIDVDIDAIAAANIKAQLDAATDVEVNTVGANTGSGNITVNSAILVDPVVVNAGSLTLDADNDIVVNQAIDVGTGSLFLDATNSVTLDAQIAAGSAGSGSVVEITAQNGGLTIGAAARIELFGDATAKIVAQSFTNNRGADAIFAATAANFWQIALPQLGAGEGDINSFGALDSGNQAVYGSGGTATVTANEYHFLEVPTIGLTVNDDVKTYGDSPASADFQLYTLDPAPFVDASLYGGVFTQDTVGNTINDAGVTYSSLGAPTTADAGTYDILASGFASTNGYDFNVAPGTLTINPRSITVTANDRTRVYGDALVLGTTEFTILDNGDGDAILPNGDLIQSVDLGSLNGFATDTTTAVNPAYTDEIAVGTVSGSQFDVNNYAITPVAGDLEITARPITVIANEQSKVYGNVASLDNTALTIVDADSDALLPNGEQIDSGTLSFAGTNLAASPIAPSLTTTDAITVTAVSGSAGFDVNNYTISYEPGDYTITPRPIVVSAQDQSKQYATSITLDGTAFSVFDTQTSSAVLPNTESIDSVAVASSGAYDADTLSGVASFTNDLVISGVDSSSNGFNASNYAITFLPGDFSITPRAITLTATQQNKTYGDALTLDNTAFTLTDLDADAVLPNGESIDTVSVASTGGLAADSSADAGTYLNNLVLSGQSGSGGFDAGNYDISYVAGNLVIGQRALEIIASQQSKIYGETLTLDNTAFTLVDTPTGTAVLPNGEQVDVVAISSATGVDADTTSGVGTYTDELVLSGQSGSNGFNADNYTITYTEGDLLVAQRAITLTALEQSKVYGNSLTLDDTAFTVADLDGDAALPNGESIDTVTVASTAGLDADSSAAAGTYGSDLVLSGQAGSNGFAASNYDITYLAGDFSITPRAITLTASQQNKTYGDALTLDNTAFTLTDLDADAVLPNGESIDTVSVASTGGLAADSSADAGTYLNNLVLSGQSGSGGFDAANYDISYVAGNLVIGQRALEIIASQQSKIYGESLSLDNTAFTLVDTPTGTAVLPNGEQVDVVAINSATGVDADTTAGVGTYTDQLVLSGQSGSNGFDADNYSITYTEGDLLVTERAITLTALEQSQIYGESVALDDTAFMLADLDGDAALPNGESIDTVNLASAGAVAPTTDVGSYANDLSITGQNGSNGFVATNYTITYVDGDYSITPRAITLTGVDQSKFFGTVLNPDGTAFTLLDVLTGTATLPNGESVDSVPVQSVDMLAQTADTMPGLYEDNLFFNDQDGSGGFDPANYDITYVAADLEVRYLPERPITEVDANPDLFREVYMGDPFQLAFNQVPALSTNMLSQLIDSPIWKRMSRMQQAWVLEQIEALDDEQKISEELINYLIAKSNNK